jgi:hypothetical protein
MRFIAICYVCMLSKSRGNGSIYEWVQVSVGGGTEGVPLQYGELNVEFLSVFVFEGFIRTCQYVLVNNAVVCRRYVCRLCRQSVEGQFLYSESSWEVC